MLLPKYIVRLTDEERTELEDQSCAGKRAVSVWIHARILLEADAGASGPGWDDGRIAEALDCGESTVYRVRQAFVERGLEAALLREKPTGRRYRKPDGAQEARLIALACCVPPEGRSRWTSAAAGGSAGGAGGGGRHRPGMRAHDAQKNEIKP